VPSGTGRGWETARCNVFCNRVFTAVAEPPDALASRCMAVLMFRTDDRRKASLSPQDDADWPTSPHDLIQRCWLAAIHHLAALAKTARTVTSDNAGLTNRDLQVWRPVLAVARLVDSANNDTAAWDGLLRLSRHLHDQRAEDDGSREATLTRALVGIAEDGNDTTTTGAALSMVKRQYAGEHGISGEEKDDAPWGLENVKKIGKAFRNMNVPRMGRVSNQAVYDLSPPIITRLRALYLPTDAIHSDQTAHMDETAETAVESNDIAAECAESAECAECAGTVDMDEKSPIRRGDNIDVETGAWDVLIIWANSNCKELPEDVRAAGERAGIPRDPADSLNRYASRIFAAYRVWMDAA
jgi:hypothetical protein